MVIIQILFLRDCHLVSPVNQEGDDLASYLNSSFLFLHVYFKWVDSRISTICSFESRVLLKKKKKKYKGYISTQYYYYFLIYAVDRFSFYIKFQYILHTCLTKITERYMGKITKESRGKGEQVLCVWRGRGGTGDGTQGSCIPNPFHFLLRQGLSKLPRLTLNLRLILLSLLPELQDYRHVPPN